MKQSILKLYQKYHRGKENAIPRDAFLLRYAGELNGLKDRDFRRIYASLDICTCNDGGYWPDKPEEAKEFYEYMKKKSLSGLERASRVKKTHEKLMAGQMELGI